jgi:1,4-alpha-glucan branching enzyme
LEKKPDEGSIEFTFNAPEAKNVSLAGDFNNWDNHSLPMKKINGKDWKVAVKLTPGRHEYKYFMDGRWVEDIPGEEKVSNSFGTQNFVIYVK